VLVSSSLESLSSLLVHVSLSSLLEELDAAAPPAKQVLVEPLVLPILCVVPLLLRILHPHAGEGLATAVAAGRASARARRRSGDGSSPPTAAAAAASAPQLAAEWLTLLSRRALLQSLVVRWKVGGPRLPLLYVRGALWL